MESVAWNIIAPAFFRGEVLPKRTSSDLVLATPHQEEKTLRLPDSGLPDIVIAPDLSNLPQGAQALDLESGKEIADDAGLRSLREDQRTMNEVMDKRRPDGFTPDS